MTNIPAIIWWREV